MTYAELKRRLQRIGVILEAEGSRHEIWLNPATAKRAPIPRHDQRDVSPGMLAAILRELGISRESFGQ